MKPHRTRAFLRAYGLLPHRLLGAATRTLMRARRPRWAVRAAIEAWIRGGAIDVSECVDEPWPTLEAFFLRRLRPGARLLGEGFVSPADGLVVGTGPIEQGTILQVKGSPLRLGRVLAARPEEVAALAGGRYVTIFLTPDGYHRLHMPCDAEVAEVRWIGGRFFPQNADALRVIPRIYERNERAALRCVADSGAVFWLVLVGASLIGGIELAGLERAAWARPGGFAWNRRLRKGEELGWFRFGSTVVIAAPKDMLEGTCDFAGAAVRVGQRLG
ncbi:archaetidylserine decarboxylase [Nannocystis sp. ILAH1]|uniref:archaetidylserine decarboxylase n=1 Tax=unclassified Nannocystis TaxID=2627009 RepID=UPI0022706913|nr:MULTISPECIES: archaetidylserine decarboxylase [unclassified Nannocystis]MCY0987386.1 archaetidylserine decarboxylase [Nannocystis sp. ILAH1]MCY1070819.1 archaetidylserine decarboxylase [Nannocystis sp. RBIL2]